MAKNLKGGYKIVSLNGLDLVGESLALEGLYDKLAKSYDKPILVTNIVIDGEKKKNAFVQVEVLDDGIKINDLYGYDLLVEEDDDITVTANPQELPDVAEASANQVLTLNAQKKPEWKNVPEELPSTEGASQGNALLLDANKKAVWGAIASGNKWYLHKILFTGDNNKYYILSTKSGEYKTTDGLANELYDDFKSGKAFAYTFEFFTGSYSGTFGYLVSSFVAYAGNTLTFKMIKATSSGSTVELEEKIDNSGISSDEVTAI